MGILFLSALALGSILAFVGPTEGAVKETGFPGVKDLRPVALVTSVRLSESDFFKFFGKIP